MSYESIAAFLAVMGFCCIGGPVLLVLVACRRINR